jgi:hypothetical protein
MKSLLPNGEVRIMKLGLGNTSLEVNQVLMVGPPSFWVSPRRGGFCFLEELS